MGPLSLPVVRLKGPLHGLLVLGNLIATASSLRRLRPKLRGYPRVGLSVNGRLCSVRPAPTDLVARLGLCYPHTLKNERWVLPRELAAAPLFHRC
jgi:hypothetical protein